MQATIYIRKENEERWNKLEDKSAWVNDKLSPLNTQIRKIQEIISSAETPTQDRYVQTPAGVVGPISLKPNGKLCKDGHAIPEGRDRCMGKGCKYS